jgi:hypothetical protein
MSQRKRDLDREQAALQAQIESLKAKLGNVHDELKLGDRQDRQRQTSGLRERRNLAVARKAD